MPKKQKSGLYRAAITIDGQRVWLSAKTTRELERKKVEARQHYINGEDPSKKLFHDAVREWFSTQQKSEYAQNTIRLYACIVNKWFLTKETKNMLCRAVAIKTLQDMLNKCAETTGHSTVSHMFTCMTKFSAYCAACGYFKSDYASALIRPEGHPTRKVAPHIAIDDALVMRLIEAAGTFSPRMQLLIQLMYYTGMRDGQALGLFWKNIDMEKHIIVLDHQRIASGKETKLKNKKDGDLRVITIPDPLMDILRPIRQLPNVRVIQMTRDTLRCHWAYTLYLTGHATLKEGMEPKVDAHCYEIEFSPHSMRHTYATKLYDANVDPVTASKILGHVSYQTTADIYTHISQERMRKANENINAVFTCCKNVAQEANDENAKHQQTQ